MKKNKKVLLYLFFVTFVFLLLSYSESFAATVGTGFDYNIIPAPTGSSTTEIKNVAKNIWKTLSFILQVASVGGVIFAGVRYMFASTETKADIKKSMLHLVIGLVIVFATTTIVNLIINVFNELKLT